MGSCTSTPKIVNPTEIIHCQTSRIPSAANLSIRPNTQNNIELEQIRLPEFSIKSIKKDPTLMEGNAEGASLSRVNPLSKGVPDTFETHINRRKISLVCPGDKPPRAISERKRNNIEAILDSKKLSVEKGRKPHGEGTLETSKKPEKLAILKKMNSIDYSKNGPLTYFSSEQEYLSRISSLAGRSRCTSRGKTTSCRPPALDILSRVISNCTLDRVESPFEVEKNQNVNRKKEPNFGFRRLTSLGQVLEEENEGGKLQARKNVTPEALIIGSASKITSESHQKTSAFHVKELKFGQANKQKPIMDQLRMTRQFSDVLKE